MTSSLVTLFLRTIIPFCKPGAKLFSNSIIQPLQRSIELSDLVPPEMIQTEPPLDIEKQPLLLQTYPPGSSPQVEKIQQQLQNDKDKDYSVMSIHLPADHSDAELPDKPRLSCNKPLRVIGVQEETPLAWSPDGKFLAFASGNRSIYILSRGQNGQYDVDSVLIGHVLKVLCLAFHPTLPLLFSGGAEGMFLWNVQTGQLAQKFDSTVNKSAHDGAVTCGIWIYGGEILITGSRDANLKAWQLRAPSPSSASSSPSLATSSTASNKNNSGNDEGGLLRCLETAHGHKAPVLCFAMCAHTNVLASAGRDSTIKLWDVSSLQPAVLHKRADDSSVKIYLSANLDGHRGDVTSLAFLSDGRALLSGSRDHDLKLWDIGVGSEIRSIPGHTGDIRRIMLLNKEALLLTACSDAQIRVWEFSPPPATSASAGGPTSTVSDSAAAAVLASISSGASAQQSSEAFLDAVTHTSIELDLQKSKDKLIVTKRLHSRDIFHLEVNPHTPNIVAVSSAEHCVRIWDLSQLSTPTLLQELVGHSKAISAVKVLGASDQHLVSGSVDSSIFHYSVSHLKRLHAFDFEGSVSAIAVSADDRFVFAGGAQFDIKGYELDVEANADHAGDRAAPREVIRLVGHSGKVEALAISADSKILVSGGHDFNIRIWKLPNLANAAKNSEESRTISPEAEVKGHAGHITRLAISDNGSTVVSAGTDHRVVVWRLTPGGRFASTSMEKVWEQNSAHDRVISGLAVNFARSLAVTCSWDGTVRLWNWMSGRDSLLRTFRGHGSKVTDVALTRDGAHAVSCSSDGSVRLWTTVAPFECAASYIIPPTEGAVNCVSAGGSVIVTGSENGMIRVWPLPIGDGLKLFVSTAQQLQQQQQQATQPQQKQKEGMLISL